MLVFGLYAGSVGVILGKFSNPICVWGILKINLYFMEETHLRVYNWWMCNFHYFVSLQQVNAGVLTLTPYETS